MNSKTDSHTLQQTRLWKYLYVFFKRR